MRVNILWVMAMSAWLMACSDNENVHTQPVAQGAVDAEATEYLVTEDEQDEELASRDCPGFEALFARLPDELEGEPVGEQYFTCDTVAPTAESHFASIDGATYWTLLVTERDITKPAGKSRWEVAGATGAQQDYLKRGVETAIKAEILMFQNCMNTLDAKGLPEWHQTFRVAVQHYDICVGSDAQLAEDGMWIARAQSPEFLYTVKLEGEKALQFANAESAAGYMGLLFTQFIPQ